MRLWSVHPKYLDARGLVALWREGLLAQAVLRGRTSGYVRHPQLRKISLSRALRRLRVTRGQLEFEWRHLLKKVTARDRKWPTALAEASE
jgi:hypothetical protein